MARRAAYDYVVVGGGFAGLNAVSGLQKFRPAASILCIDKHDAAGGSWNDYYSFCKLHAPHPTFGIAGHGWPGLASPNVLATRDEVLRHFRSFAADAPNLEFLGGASYEGCARGPDGALVATLGDGSSVAAREQIIRATGYDYERHMPAHLDGVSDGSAEEVECANLPAAVAARGEETLYVVVGGGKTGADAVCFLGEHRRRGDDVLLVTGSSKGFFVRDEVFPDQGSQSVFQPMITEVMLDMIAAWDGTDASERAILNDMVARGTLCSLGGSEVANTGLGVLSRAEQAAVEATAEIVANDHYKDFDDINARTSFYFIASVWFDDLADLADTLEADTIVYNQGWWQLKDCRGTYCGDDFDDECEANYREDLGQVIDHLFSRATTAVYRTTACCGEEDDDWIDGIEAQNAVAKDVMAAAGVPVADVHGFYGWDDLDAATFDGFHANVATCPLW